MKKKAATFVLMLLMTFYFSGGAVFAQEIIENSDFSSESVSDESAEEEVSGEDTEIKDESEDEAFFGFDILQSFFTGGGSDDYGSITVCKIVIDDKGNIIIDDNYPDAVFSLIGDGDNDLVVEFSYPLDLNTNLLDGEVNDAECVVLDSLNIEEYYYSEEIIDGDGNWSNPLYNDQYYDSFDSIENADEFDMGDDIYNADGIIDLTNDAGIHRTLILVNKFESDG